MERQIERASLVTWPDGSPADNFKFDVIDQAGTFKFNFKWLNDRWNCWVTLPDETIREAGVYPGVISWSGTLDFGLVFETDLPDISRSSLFMTDLYIIKWQ